MKKVLKIVLSKSFVIGLLILAQLVFLGFLIDRLVNNKLIGIYIHTFFIILSIIVVIFVVSSNINPEYKIAWIIPLLAFPVFGTFFYLLYHQNNITPKRIEKYNKIVADRNKLLKSIPNELDYKEIVYLNNNGWRYYRNSKIELLSSGQEKLDKLLIDLNNASEFILIEYFIISKGKMYTQIFDVLKKKAKEGVEIKIIYDDFGSVDNLPFNFKHKMKKCGIDVIPFNRINFHLNFSMNYRTHRKIVVIDNKIAYTGGINIGDEYINDYKRFGHWHDSSFRITGSAVWSLTLIFLENWNFSSKNQVDYDKYYREYEVNSNEILAPFADNPIEDYLITKSALLYLIGEAKSEILITTPYLILDNEIITALKLAVKSGVDVKIIIPGIPDKKLVYLVSESYALDLVKAGVKIYKYKPGFIHSKMYLFDNKKAIVGTTNLDFRSLYLHFENNVLVYNSPVLNEIRKYILDTIKNSEIQSIESLKKNKLIVKFVQSILRGFSPSL